MSFELRIVGCADYESCNLELGLLAKGIFIAQLILNYIIPNRRSRQLKIRSSKFVIRNSLYEV